MPKTQDDIDRVYQMFNKTIDRLSDVLMEHCRRQEKMNDRMEIKIRDLESDWRMRDNEISHRIKTLEDSNLTRETKENIVFKFVQNFPKSFITVFFILCVFTDKALDRIYADQKLTEPEITREIPKENK